MNYPKLANCTFKDIVKACKKLGNCTVSSASKHVIKITHNSTQKATVLPNGNPLKRGLVWDFVRSFLQKTCNFSEKQIFDVLWC